MVDLVLGRHSADLVNLWVTADRKSCSTPKFTKSYESPTAMLRILAPESAFDTSRFFLPFYAWLKVACARIAALHKVLHYLRCQ